MFAKLKALLRKAATRTRQTLWNTIGRMLDAFRPTECSNYLKNSGHEFDRSLNALVDRDLTVSGPNQRTRQPEGWRSFERRIIGPLADDGSQHMSVTSDKRYGKAGLRRCMGSVGRAYNNALAKNFLSTLEARLLSRRWFTSQTRGLNSYFSYIDGWVRPGGLALALGYLLREHRRAAGAECSGADQAARSICGRCPVG